jgi:hypothetical protein
MKRTIKDPEQITAKQFQEAFQKVRPRLGDHHLAMLQAHYSAPKRRLTAIQMAHELGYQGYRPANRHYGTLAVRLCEELGYPEDSIPLALLVSFIKPSGHWLWVMRPQVAHALEELGWVDGAKTIMPQAERHYWVVSPNVKNNPKTVAEWKKESIKRNAAFMGYEPNSWKYKMGPKFAGRNEGIMPGDVVLIARRSDGKPDVVGFGVIHGESIKTKRLKRFHPPGNDDDSGSLRNLRPFIVYRKYYSGPPRGIPIIEVLPPRGAALRQLHPENGGAHKKVCDWMDQHLGKEGGKAGEKQRAITKSKDKRKLGLNTVAIVDPPKNHQSGYKVQKKSEVIKADNIEAKLLCGYRNWLEKKGRRLKVANYHNRRLQCDGCEVKRRNLIEAKASTSRENIRMAVGQLLDYAFLGKEKIRNPNMAVLLPKEPDSDLVKWLRHLHISIIWREKGLFRDNADGWFTAEKENRSPSP